MSQLQIRKGLSLLLEHDDYLLALDVNERSITHRLGMYYQFIFPEWNVDCEFNKNLSGPKEINLDPHMFLDKMADALEADSTLRNEPHFASKLREDHITIEDVELLKSQLRDPERLRYDAEFDVLYFVLTLSNGNELRKLIYPDIIVHKRGTQNNNIVIEAKKSTNHDRLSRAYDLVKLVTLVSDKDYGYKKGYFIDIPTGRNLVAHKNFTFQRTALDSRVFIVGSSR